MDWPEKWADDVREFEGHILDSVSDDRSGEELLQRGLSALCVHHGVEVACHDISGAVLDPALVGEARGVEMGYFKTMGVYDRVPRSEQAE